MAEKRSPNGVLKPYKMKDSDRFGIAASLGKDENGKRLRHIETGKTEQEVINKMRRWLVNNGYLEEETIVINGWSTIEELIEEFKIRSLTDSGISDVTFQNYSYSLALLEKYFQGRRIMEIDTYEMNRFFSWMANVKKNNDYRYGKTAIDRTAYIANKMFKRAVGKNYIAVNPMDDEDFKKPCSNKKSAPITALSKEEIKTLKDVLATNKVIYPVFILMAATGMRTQEALGLQWRDINFSDHTIHIQRAITKEIMRDEHGNKISAKTVLGPTKSGSSERILIVSDETIEFLKKWKRTAPKISKTKVKSTDFVFGNSKGPSWTCDGFRASVSRCLSKANMDRLRLHRLRHTVATMFSNQPDVTVFNIMQLLGHTQIKTAQKYIDAQTQERAKKNKELLERVNGNAELFE